jgi:hypothetical protein
MEVSQSNSKQTKMPSFKNREQVGGWHQWEGEEYKENVKEGECSGNTTYSCMQMEKRDLLKLFQEWRKGDKGE